jgi:hypothetical protein
MDMFLRNSLLASILLAALVGNATAQTSGKVAKGAGKAEAVAEAPKAAAAEAADAAATTPVKSGEPEGNGRWVPRVDKKTCPNGSEPYLDEKDGGVKCWVNSN